MNKFFKYLQPTIIQATFDEELPEKVRGRYFINFNVFGINYFDERYILQENEYGTPYLILRETIDPNPVGAFLMEYSQTDKVLDIPRIYIDITDKFINDPDNLFQSLVCQAIADNRIWVCGIDNFLAGKDYYTNYSLYNYLAQTDQIEVPDFSVRLPNYLDSYGFLQKKFWNDLSGEVFKDYNNLEYFNEKNNLLTNKFSEEELNNFYSTFCATILKYTKINEDKMLSSKNQIYNLVLNYFKNFKSDDTSNILSLILNSGYTITKENQKISGCGCNSTSSGDDVISLSCFDTYNEAMYLWLKNMLSDKDFYQDWFMIYKSEEDYIPNDVLIENMKTLFKEFISLQRTLTFIVTKRSLNCSCPEPQSFNESECNYIILDNYSKVFDWVFNDSLDANTNKIKIYGTRFSELLPNLQF